MNGEKAFESHSLVISDRRHSELTGIDDVLSFDDSVITVHSALGDMSLEGEELKIDSFSSDKGVLSVSGKVCGVYYHDQDEKRRPQKRRSAR